MGKYIEVPRNKNKAEQLVAGQALMPSGTAPQYEAEILAFVPASFTNIPEGKALVCVVDNGMFEAAAFCCDEQEFRKFTDPADYRPKTWVLMDRAVAQLCAGSWEAGR